jgi:hypothetical protein
MKRKIVEDWVLKSMRKSIANKFPKVRDCLLKFTLNNNMIDKDTTEKIKKLQEELASLYNIERESQIKALAPYLIKNKFQIQAGFTQHLSVSHKDKSIEDAFVELFSKSYGGGCDLGWNHFDGAISKNIKIAYDDGKISIYPCNKVSNEVFYKELKSLGFKADFKWIKDRLKKDIREQQKQLEKIEKLERKYNEN